MGKNKHSAEMPKSPKRPQIDFKAQQQAQHAATISLIVKNTGKIQKEIGFRRNRLKEVSQKCGYAIEYLNKFKDITWPPPKTAQDDGNDIDQDLDISQANTSIDLEEDVSKSGSEVGKGRSTEDATTENGEEEDNVNIGIASVTTEEEEEANENAEFEARIEGRFDELDIDDDDTEIQQESEEDNEESPKDQMEIRQEVKFAIDCYCTTITHPAATAKMIEIALECIGLLISNRYVVGSTAKKKVEELDESDSISSDGDRQNASTSDVMRLINCICTCAENPSDSVQSAMTKALLSLMTSPVCSVHEAGMLKSVRTVFHIYLITRHDEVKQTSRSVLLDMLRSVFLRMESYDAMIKVDNESGDVDESFEMPNVNLDVEDGDNNHRFASMFHTDSYLLFRALCKLSAKTLPEDVDDQISTTSSAAGNLRVFTGSKAPSDPMATATKILSLELILCVFEHCGPAFREGEKFIYAVQNFLCVSLLKNCVSSNTAVAHLSLKVFLLLVYKFKNHMKSEIEVFIANVFLPVLESPNCPFERKSLVLEALRALCVDPMILTSIFLNYDCDFDAVNLYKTIVYHLTSLSVRGRTSAPTPTNKTKPVNEKFALSVAGLEVLVVILQGFLKALDLPGGDDVPDEERSKVRGSLQLDVGMAVKSEMDNAFRKQKPSVDDVPVTAEEMKNIENSTSDAEDVAGKIVDAFDKKRAAQQTFELGIVKFKLSAKQGLLFFIKNGLLQMDAKEIASFFNEHKEVLDKTQIGEIFGREPEASFVKGENVDPEKGGLGFYIRVLHHYVDGLEFTGLKFDDAIRLFLSGFRLPGESQKVDRVMEKFAERFTLHNPGVFPSADTAFILAFAVIMLQTDLHNPNIKPEKKMTEDSFVKMNKGISVDGADLPVEFLKEIFRSIKARPITLKEDVDERNFRTNRDENGMNDIFGTTTGAEERRRKKFKKESAELVESTEKLFKKQKATSSSSYTNMTSSVNPSDVVKPMFDITWGPLLGALSQILEKANDDSSIALCLNGFVYAVRIASHTRTTLAKNTFVNSLAKFTALGSIRELKTRNIESIRTLLSIAIMDGENLGESWMPILQCISQLGRLLFFASGVDSDDNFLNNDSQSVTTTQTSESRETEEMNATVVLEAINEVLIEKVFSSSTKLSDAGILNLIDCLVLVSVSEIEGDSKKTISGAGRALQSSDDKTNGETSRKPINGVDGPRVYSLQKLVEVADYNMNSRSRLSWAKIWELMAGHFIKIGCNDNAMVSMFAVHALRQLSFKFLEKPELADFNFQRLFLQPFLSITENQQTRSDTRELILECIDNTTKAFSHNIRSGWKTFFAILSLSANDASASNISLGLSILDRLFDSHLDDFCYMNKGDTMAVDDEKEEKTAEQQISRTTAKERSALAEDFISLCRSSAAFLDSNQQIPMALSMKALCHLARYSDRIAEGKILPPLSKIQTKDPAIPGYTYEGLSKEEERTMVLWRPIIDGLTAGMCSTTSSLNGEIGCFIQRGSVITLRSILLRYGHTFTPAQWKAMMSQSILPSMNRAACNDTSPVMKIISESPSVSNLDFLTEPLPLPPGNDDAGLLKFASVRNAADDGESLRPMGHAELLAEATLVDLIHRGNKDPSQAHTLLNKDKTQNNIDEPFPDSWVATTAPLALGMLTDFFCLIGTQFDVKDAKELWPATLGQMQKWAVGFPFGYSNSTPIQQWTPCEALVRIACKEISHLSETVFTLFPRMKKKDVALWLGFLCQNLAETLSYNIELEKALHSDVSREINEESVDAIKESTGKWNAEELQPNKIIETPFGTGTLVGKRVDSYDDKMVELLIVKLESGATLFGPVESKRLDDEIENKVASPVTEVAEETNNTKISRKEMMNKYIYPLRVRCTSIYCVQQSLFGCLEMFSSHCSKDDISLLLEALESSRAAAAIASVDRSLPAYFEEAIRMEWGGKVEEPQAAFSSNSGVGHLGRCEMFFLTQEASASNVIVRILSLLYCPRSEDDLNEWDTVAFSEQLLMSLMTDVLKKFIISERENGHKLDPNVWRVASESGTKFAIHCTSFAGVVVNILYTILGFTDEQFDRQKATLFPILCSLILIQSEEIRMLVAKVLNQKVSVLLGIS